MKLKAKVVSVESATNFSDRRQRITLQFQGAEAGFRKIIIANEGLNLDDELEVTVNVKSDYSDVPFMQEKAA